jgi:hypothetical protein
MPRRLPNARTLNAACADVSAGALTATSRVTQDGWHADKRPRSAVRKCILAGRVRVLPAEFAEPGVVNAEVVADLVDDGAADLVGDLVLAVADRADRLLADGDPVGQHARILRGARCGW